MRVVGLSGKIGTGKTTLANMFLRMMGGATRRAFGDPVKEEVAEKCNIPLEWMYDQDLKLNIVPACKVEDFEFPEETVRERLQHYGTDFRRAQDPLYWIKLWTKQVLALAKDHVWILTDDLRFVEEVEAVRQFGKDAFIIRLDPYPEWVPGKYAEHISEMALDDYQDFDLRVAPGFNTLPELFVDVVKAIVTADQSTK